MMNTDNQTAADRVDIGAPTAAPVRFLDRTTPPHIGTLVFMTGVSALTMSVFLPALPRMTEYFQTDYRLMQLSVALYLGINALLQVFVGPLSDQYGRRPVLLIGFGLFVLASIGCIYAPTAHVFLGFRMAQAAVVVAMVLSRAVVRDMFGQAESASKIGYVTMGMSVVPMLGPAVGGWLTNRFDWQANFWLLTVLGIITFAMIWADLGETAKSRGKPFREQLVDYPELLTSPRFWGYTLSSALSSGAFFAYLGGAPFVGSEIFHLSPTILGFCLGIPASGYFFGNFISGRYSVEVGIDKMILWGSLLVCGGLSVSLILFTFGGGSALSFFGLMTFVGLGNGMVLPNAAAGMLSVRPSLAGTASGLGGMMQLAGGAALAALAGAMLGPDTGAAPLLWIMLAAAVGAVLAIWYVIRRTRFLG